MTDLAPRSRSAAATATTALRLLVLSATALLLAACGATAPIDVGETTMGGDANANAQIHLDAGDVSGVEPGDTVAFYPGLEEQAVAESNPVTVRFFEVQGVEDAARRGRPNLTIYKTVAFAGTSDFRRDVLVDVDKYAGKDVGGAIKFTVSNTGTEAIATFLIVDHLPEGMTVQDGAQMTTTGDGKPEWEFDEEGRILVRETQPLVTNEVREYVVPVLISVPDSTD